MNRKGLSILLAISSGLAYACATAPGSTDTVPPALNLTEPQQNAVYYGSVTFRGTASDDVALDKVEVSIASGAWVAATGTSDWSYQYNFGLVTNDTRNVRIRALDTSANAAELSVTLYFGGATNVCSLTNYFVSSNSTVVTNIVNDTNLIVSYVTNYVIETNYVYLSNDTVAPVVSLTSATNFYEPEAALTGTAMDMSGVKEVWFGNDGINFKKAALVMDGSMSYWSTNLALGLDASETVYFYAVDFNDNASLTNAAVIATVTPPYVCVSTSGSDAGYGTVKYPFRTIQKAVDAAASDTSRVTIRVESGVYIPGSGLNASGCGVSITNADNLTLSGGWNSNFSVRNGVSVLDGQKTLYHVIYAGTNVISGLYALTNLAFENLVIVNGFANGADNSSPAYNRSGAGIMLSYAYARIEDCVFSNNVATNTGSSGGAAICVKNYSCDVLNSYISGNLSANSAVAIMPGSSSWGVSLVSGNTICSNTTIGIGKGSGVYCSITADIIGNEVFENAFVDQLLSVYGGIVLADTWYLDNSRCISNVVGAGGADLGYGIIMEDGNTSAPNFVLAGNNFITNKLDYLVEITGNATTIDVAKGPGWTNVNVPAFLNNMTTSGSIGNSVSVR